MHNTKQQHTHKHRNKEASKQTETHTHTHTHSNKQANRQRDKQTNTHTHTNKHTHTHTETQAEIYKETLISSMSIKGHRFFYGPLQFSILVKEHKCFICFAKSKQKKHLFYSF